MRSPFVLNSYCGFEPQIAALMGSLEEATQDCRGDFIRDLTDERLLTWQPYNNFHSIGVLLLHIAVAESFWFTEVGEKTERDPEELKTLLSEETDQNGGKWPKPPERPIEWYFEQQDTIRKRSLEIASRWTDPEGLREWRHGAISVGWIIAHVTAHEAYHYGQIMLLISLYERQFNLK